MDEQTKAAFTSAAETSKQILSLATGVITLEITFLKDVALKAPFCLRYLLGTSWILLLLSVVAGVWALLALTGTLGSSSQLNPASISGTNIKVPAALQILLFLFGLLLSVAFGMFAVNAP